MTDSDGSLASLIIAHLQTAVGKPLLAVGYFVLWNDFDAERPNESGGCEMVLLDFDGVEVEFDWGSDPRLLVPDVGYHIQTADYKRRRDTAREWFDDDVSGLNWIVVSWKPVWRRFLGKPLEGFEIWGAHSGDAVSPQAIRLIFPDGGMTLAVGKHSGNRPVAGDGDEILVFPDAEWPPGIAPSCGALELLATHP